MRKHLAFTCLGFISAGIAGTLIWLEIRYIWAIFLAIYVIVLYTSFATLTEFIKEHDKKEKP